MRGSRTAASRLRGMVSCCCLLSTRSCPVWQTRALTDVLNFLYHCLPNHRSALAKGVGGGPSFQGGPGLLLENTREEQG